MIDLMIDLETLSTKPNAVILSLGAVKFNPYNSYIDIDNGLDIKVDVDSQITLGRDVQEDTLTWWTKQPAEVQDAAFGLDNRASLASFVTMLNKAMVGVDHVWCQGPVFDIVILENLYKQLGVPVPWNYWQIRDSRTLFGVFGDPRTKNRKEAHNALMDCYYQAIGVQGIYKQQNIQSTYS